MKEIKKGGKRDGSGRKPTDDPKIPITIYVETSRVQRNGGKTELARRINDAVNTDFAINEISERIKESNKPENKKRILEQREPKKTKEVKISNPANSKTFLDMEAEFQSLLKNKKDGKNS